ncbi:MAG: DinB family protein [Bacteroidota bacterium]
MKKTTILMLLFCLIVSTLFAQNGQMTKEERKFLLNHLKDTEANLLSAIHDISDKQWVFKRDDESWSPAECAVHILKAEKHIFETWRVKVLETDPEPERVDEVEGKESQITKEVPNREQKFKSPEKLQPGTELMSKADFKKSFQALRTKIRKYVKSTSDDLHFHFTQAPANLGVIDTYQLMLVLSNHTGRHTAQIDEIKTSNGFDKIAKY